VRVSLVAFGHADQGNELNGAVVTAIHPDLTFGDGVNMAEARQLPENSDAAFQGPSKVGSFDIDAELAGRLLRLPNPHGRSNADVVRPWFNGSDVTDRWTGHWIIDFGTSMSEAEASLYEAPFAHVVARVRPDREKNNREAYRRYWFRFAEARAGLRRATAGLRRFIVTPRVAKHRVFAWLDASACTDTRLYVLCREDDASMGLLHSRIHKVWSLAAASMHGVGNDPTYNAKSCFETFPFPEGLTPADTAHQQTEVLDVGAGQTILIPAASSQQPAASSQQPAASSQQPAAPFAPMPSPLPRRRSGWWSCATPGSTRPSGASACPR
jgi:hypothetical protein